MLRAVLVFLGEVGESNSPRTRHKTVLNYMYSMVWGTQTIVLRTVHCRGVSMAVSRPRNSISSERGFWLK